MGTPSECPVCRRIYCDHTPDERGQTFAEMMGDPPDIVTEIGRICLDCGKQGRRGPRVALTALGLPAASTLVLPSDLARLVEIAREKLAKVCVCADIERRVDLP